jgi:hypothetical protein
VNFPQVHGARLQPVPDPELAEAEARLAALDGEELVAVQPEWIDATVAKVAAAAPVARAGRLRRAAAAAVAFFALHGFATAATVTAVAVTAVVLWPEGRNSSETMSYELARQLLLQQDESDDKRASAMFQIVRRVQGVLGALQAVDRDAQLDSAVRGAAADGLRQIADCLAGRQTTPTPATVVDPLPTLETLRSPGGAKALTEPDLIACTRAACSGLASLRNMPTSSDRLVADREVYWRRLTRMLAR